MLRHFEDARVLRVPDDDQIRQMKKEMPEARLRLEVEPGDRLSDMPDQDSYSFEYAVLFLGASDQHELNRKYKRCRKLLNFEFAPCAPAVDRPGS